MFQQLVNHNDDIRRLVEKGYAVGFNSGHMVIRDIPYLDDQKECKIAAIVTKLEFVNKEKVIQTDHQIFFAGEIPYGLDGKMLNNLGGGPAQIPLDTDYQDVVVQRSFSNKPKTTGKFNNFFDKIESYVSIISGPAMELHDVSPYTFNRNECVSNDTVFKFQDTLTSRAEISDLSGKLTNDVIAIIGLGGTGSYLLDFMVKTPVREIRGFDRDVYHVHNAFRSAGKLDESELGLLKADIYQARYENFRDGIVLEPINIDEEVAHKLDGVSFAFVCVDKGSARSEIFDILIEKGIPYIDVGMGLKREEEGSLKGMLRATYFPNDKARDLRKKNLAEEVDNPDDIYKSNIQISELNALNACIAVMKYKQLRKFYHHTRKGCHILFNIASMKVVTDVDEN